MSEFEPTETFDEMQAAGTDSGAPRRPRWMRVLTRIGIGIGTAVVLVGVLGALAYNFGGMSGSAIPGIEGQYDELVASGQAQPVRQRFVIPIPGCTCHSTDPVLTAQHSVRHMNECVKCHNTNPPHLEPGVL